ncbi:putative HNH endonuclease [Acinetobacter phage P577]|uniref:HNH endonuclease n=1 Tax=Acinetobacter phage YMC13/03/R2096 TaxID=1560342 RepID=UPI00052A96BE|nr:HNH endonuclease [Acinetobacter phage YMC13/03/R2096]AIW02806.1 putative HNH endonuclease [Acinetobacter phage YMC13/03/R2096]WNT46130.1 putative HNH endonuclease [Acinetobacter phage P577]
MEKFKHPKFSGYSCDVFGNVYGKRGQLMRGCLSTTGYRQYEFNGVTENGHRFVWECIKGVIPKGFVINHIDANKLNNCIENLEVVKQEDNVHHHYRNFWENPNKNVSLSGARYRNSTVKLTKDDAEKVIRMCLAGFTNKQISRVFGIHSRYVSLIRHKKRWKALWLELGLESSTTIPSGSRS